MNARRTLACAALALVTGFALTACGSKPPTQDKMQADTAGFKLPATPGPGKAMVYVVRPSGSGSFTSFNVFVDAESPDAQMGSTKPEQYIYFELRPRSYVIKSKGANLSEVSLDLKAGDIVFLRQEPSLGMTVVIAENSLSVIADTEGKYFVKTLKPGTILKKSN